MHFWYKHSKIIFSKKILQYTGKVQIFRCLQPPTIHLFKNFLITISMNQISFFIKIILEVVIWIKSLFISTAHLHFLEKHTKKVKISLTISQKLFYWNFSLRTSVNVNFFLFYLDVVVHRSEKNVLITSSSCWNCCTSNQLLYIPSLTI